MVNISLGFDPFACILALIALWTAYREIRRSNVPRLKVVSCEMSFRHCAENGGEPFHEFRVLLRNEGATLHDIKAELGYVGKENSGWWSIPLPNRQAQASPDTVFMRGMMVEYVFKSYELDDSDKHWLAGLSEPLKQNATITIYSQGFKAFEIRVGRRLDRVRLWWNRLAWRITDTTRREVGKNERGDRITAYLIKLPTFIVPSDKLMSFISALKSRYDV